MFTKRTCQFNAKYSQSGYLSSNKLNTQVAQFFFTICAITLASCRIRFIDKYTQKTHTQTHTHIYINGHTDKWPMIVERTFGEAVFKTLINSVRVDLLKRTVICKPIQSMLDLILKVEC